MRVVGYVRVSTEEQSREGVSLEAQRSKVTGYAELHDLELVEVVEDPGGSAKSMDRPGLARVLEMLDAGRAEGVVILKLDRLTRSLADWSTLIALHFGPDRAATRKLFSVQDHIDTRSPSGRLVLNVLMSVAQWEREEIAKRTRDALRHKIDRGERVGKVLYGFDLHPDGKTLTPNEAERGVIRVMATARAEGLSYRAIARMLRAAGVRPREGADGWHPDTISKILRRYRTRDQPEAQVQDQAPAA